MRIKRSWKTMVIGAAGLALVMGLTLFSKPAPAGPTVTVYRSPT